MELKLQGKIAIVLASSKGLGKAVAMELAREGTTVVIASRNKTVLEKTAAEIRKETKVEVLAIVIDVSKQNDLKKLIKATVKKFGRIDILVNNAGGPPPGGFENVTDRMWQQSLNQNFFSVVWATRLALPWLKKSGSGRIINLLGTAAKQPVDNLILSNAVRAGVAGLAKSMANEFAKYKITLNSVCMGPFLTDRVREIHRNQASINRAVENVPLKRFGKPEELGALVAFLSSDRAAYITGTTIQIDGGVTKSIF